MTFGLEQEVRVGSAQVPIVVILDCADARAIIVIADELHVCSARLVGVRAQYR